MDCKEIVYSPMGDSLTWGQGASDVENTFAVLLSAKIKQAYNIEVTLKEGIRDAGRGIRSSALPKINQVISEKPNLITIEYGTNDYNIKRKRDFSSPLSFYKALNEIVNQLEQYLGKNIKIILVTTWNSSDEKYKWFFSSIYDSIIKRVGKKRGLPVADISSVWRGRTDTHILKTQIEFHGLKGDGFHPNDKAYNEIANIIYEQIKINKSNIANK